MGQSPLLRATDAAVEFELFNSELKTLKRLFTSRPGASDADNVCATKIRALNGINISLTSGDRLALIGANGAGKTTLLKLLSGIYFPTAGRVDRQGSVSSIFSLGLGFDSDASGMDNIYLSLLLSGAARSQIDDMVDDIVNFAELNEFIHLPVRTYSSGMLMRLSFAVGTSMVPDILIIDEVFGAGDKDFYQKSLKRMEDLFEKSGILVFSSHNDLLLSQYCNQAIFLEKGAVMFKGGVSDAFSFRDARMTNSA